MGVKKYNFTDDQINNIINLHNDGLFNHQIAEIYGVSKSTIARIIQNSGVQSRHPLLTSSRKEAVCKLYLEGKCKSDIEKELHISTSTINDILYEYNIETDVFRINRKYSFDYKFFDEIDNQNKAYILGLLLSDGNVSSNTSEVTLSLQEDDVEILQKVNDVMKNKKPLLYVDYYHNKNQNWKNHYRLSFQSKYTKKSLAKYGCIPNKSLVLQYPNILPKEFNKDLIRGYLDGDGHISKSESRVRLTSTRSFCNSVKSILESELGIHCTIMSEHKSETTASLQIAGTKQCKKFLDWIYDDAELYLDRKHNIYLDKYCVA